MANELIIFVLASLIAINGGYIIEPKLFDFNEVSKPPVIDHVKMARDMVHRSSWTSMSTISTQDTIRGFPMVNIISVADSAADEPSTGKIYFMVTMLDFTAQDLSKDNRATLLFSMDQDLSCSRNGTDPMEPTCARIMISGKVVKVVPDTSDFEFGKHAMYSRHPAAEHWNATHSFILCKLDIVQVVVLDWYGGPHFITPEEYYNGKSMENNGDISVNYRDSDEVLDINMSKNSKIKIININQY